MVSKVGLTKIQRRRIIGGSDQLPSFVREYYPEGQASALSVIARVARRDGQCDLTYDRIGKLAGVSRSTVRATVKEAVALGHLTIVSGVSKGESNVLSITFL